MSVVQGIPEGKLALVLFTLLPDLVWGYNSAHWIRSIATTVLRRSELLQCPPHLRLVRSDRTCVPSIEGSVAVVGALNEQDRVDCRLG